MWINFNINIFLSNIKRIYNNKQYKLFEGPLNINIIGIRSKDKNINTFNDYICLLFQDDYNEWELKCYKATTDPGLFYSEKPLNPLGVAILKEGQYLKSHKLGTHKGYNALIQNSPLMIYRDNNKDSILDMDKEYKVGIESGINIHRAHPTYSLNLINKYSAGCQVIKSPWDYNQFIDIIFLSSKRYNDIFSYTLLNENDFTHEFIL